MSRCNVTCVILNDEADTSSWPKGAPNPDVSGIGVLIGFLATAYLTLSIVCVYYVVGYVPEEFLNRIDKGILDLLWCKARSKPTKIWEPTLRTAVLMFSDQQLVTGIALLASGYAQLPCGLSSYHWQMIIYLAWFSSLTHLTTLTVLRQYFCDNPAARRWRATFMLLMVTMLGVALLPTGDVWWLGVLPPPEVARLPAFCYFKRLVSRTPENRYLPDIGQTTSMCISLMVLFSSYLTRTIKLSKRSTAFTRLWMRTKPARFLKDRIDGSIQRADRVHGPSYWRLEHLVLETMYVCLRAWFDIYESTLWELLWLCFALGWGTRYLFSTRNLVRESGFDTSEENTWGFGQMFPVILLALPMLSVGEHYHEKKQTVLRERGHDVHNVQSNAVPETYYDNRQFRVFRVGQWPKARASVPVTPSIALRDCSVIRRTGTDLQHEEADIGVVHSRTNTDPNKQVENNASGLPQPHDPSSAEDLVVTGNQGLESRRDYYRFEWFRILIGMMFLMISENAMFVIYQPVNLMFVATTISPLLGIGIGIFSTVLYAGIFVVLTEYHDTMEKTVEKYLRLGPDWQRKCLRFWAYVYPCGPIVTIACFATGLIYYNPI